MQSGEEMSVECFREVLLKLNWSHDNWDTLYKRTSFKVILTDEWILLMVIMMFRRSRM